MNQAFTPSLTLPAPGKLNLCLNITGRRDNGYHELQTVFQLISECDQLTFESAEHIEVVATQGILPEENLVYLAAKALVAYVEKIAARTRSQTLQNKSSAIGGNRALAENRGVKITLQKNLPMGAGLGGGSSDAATTLVGLNYFWGLDLSIQELISIGRPLGADIPVFIQGESAWAEGIGDQLSPMMLPKRYYLVIRPNCFISTAEIFSHSQLTRDSAAITIARFLEVGSGNDCEAIARKLYPEVDQALIWLNQRGPAKMTGTGSCVFLDFETKHEAEAVKGEVPEKWQSFITEGLNQSPLFADLPG